MSRIGKQKIIIPDDTSASFSDGVLKVSGPKGEISRGFKPKISINIKDQEIVLEPKGNSKEVRALWGTYASHIKNMLEGVNEPFSKTLIVEGVGYRAGLEGNKLVMQLGFSHPIELDVPDGIDVSVEKEKINISGVDKELVGHFASVVRSKRKPEPYKGKGIRYKDEIIRRKQGKRAVGTA